MDTKPKELTFRQAYRLITGMLQHYDASKYGNAILPADIMHFLPDSSLTAKEKALAIMALIGEGPNAFTLVLDTGHSIIRVSRIYIDTLDSRYFPCNIQHPRCARCRMEHSWETFYVQYTEDAAKDDACIISKLLRQARIS